ncbi:M-phase-specific PLK1-interacting protein-like [Lutzomyia longipalpis]|uniref:M-phase-specific PLK1-interacting protein-like n=1 Tax=Lutzomyia longipalpis TaxID=7200 RepID=UPI0024839A03|nr:M-phase-specific PLK1-interacting protein-like [Lutzomyia longipalpis]
MNQPFYFDNRRRSQGNNGQSPRSPFNSPNQQQSPGSGDFRGFNRRGGYHHRHSFPQSPYRQHYSPHASRGSRDSFRGRNSQNFMEKREVPISKYFHPSMLEDPWAALLGKISESSDGRAGKDDKDAEEIPNDSTEVVPDEQEEADEMSQSIRSEENDENCEGNAENT